MNKHNLNRVLQDIVTHDLPEEIDVWNKIEAKLPNKTTQRSIFRFVTAPALTIIFVVLLVLGTATYAFLGPGNGKRDKGLTGAQEAGLYTEINQIQILDDIEITVTEGYADTQRIAISFEISPENFDPNADFFVGELWDATGNKFLESAGGYTDTSVDLTFYTQVLKRDENGDLIFDQAFMDSYMQNVGASIDFVLDIYLIDSRMVNVSNGEYRDKASFEFTLPISQAQNINVNEEISINAINIRLETLELAPSQSLALVCVYLPDAQDWQPIASLSVDGELAQLEGSRMTQLPTPEDTERCFEQSFNIFYDQNPSNIVLTVEKIQLSAASETPEYWDEVVRILAEDYDIEVISVFEGYGHRLEEISRPEDMADEEFWQTVMLAQSDASPSIEGPWIFEVSVE